MSADQQRPSFRPHGGLTAALRAQAELGDGPVIDFSVNVNPYGPTAQMLAAIRDAPADRYPDDQALAARAALGALWDAPVSNVVLGNGAADLLWLLARTLVAPGQQAIVAGPTFSEFGAAAGAITGATVHDVRASEDDGFRVNLGALSDAIAGRDARAVYLCSPNNPTGVYIGPDAIADLARRHPATTFVIDQAFLSLSEHAGDAQAPRPGNVVLVRSLTKDHAIPGVRLGAALMDPALAARLESARPSWSTGAAVQAAALAAARAADFVASSAARLLDDRRSLQDELRRRGADPRPSSTIFFLLPVPDASALTQALLRRHRILIRDGTSFGLPGHVRLGARPASDRRALLHALATELGLPGAATATS